MASIRIRAKVWIGGEGITMIFESLWANISYLLSFVDPIINRDGNNGDNSIWGSVLNSTAIMSSHVYYSIAEFVDISHYLETVSDLTSNGIEITKNATHAVGVNILSGQFNSVIDILNFELNRARAWFDFSEFQFRLLREFSLILAGNFLLVLIAWKVYGPRISARFLARSTSGGSHKQIEELRTSMSELQLPKELDFKYK